MKYLFLIWIMLVYACSSSTTEVVSTNKPKQNTIQKPKQILTTCTTLFDLDPEIRSKTEDAFTLYRDQIRFKNYEEAEELWKLAYHTAPGSNGRATYHFDDGIRIYHHYFEKATDPSKKKQYVKTILDIYDKRLECFEDDGTVKARKAFNSYYSYREFVDNDQIFNDFVEVVDRKGVKADYFIVNPFSRMLYDRLIEDRISRQEGKRLVMKIFDIIDYGKANCKDEYCDAWEVIEEYSPELLSGLEGYRGFYDCSYYMEKYYPQYLSDPHNCENINEVYLKMVWAECPATNERFQNLKSAKEKECYVPPPPPGPLKQAYAFLEAGQFREAIQKFDEYVVATDDAEKKAEKLLIISKIYYAHIKNFPAARQYALRAAQFKPNWGEPYMLIGKLYASSGPLCGPGRGWDSQVVTWAAIDKFNYAKSIDPSVATEANRWITRYRQYMPKKEDIFFRSLNQGDSYFVPCWIQESTRIRTSD